MDKKQDAPPAIKKTTVPPKPKGVPTHRRTVITKKVLKQDHPREIRGKKSSKIQAEQILQEVIYLISNFTGRPQIIQYTAKKWGIGDRATDEYIARANAHLKASGAVDRDAAVGQALERIKEIRQMAKTAQDIKALVSIENTLAKMLIPERKEITGADGGPIATESKTPVVISPEQLFEAANILRKAEGKQSLEKDSD